MNALLLAAGLGTRLKPLTNEIPKCLVPIKGTPLLAYWLKMFEKSNFKNVLINTHYFSQFVNDYIKGTPCKNIIISHEKLLTGTAGPIKFNKNILIGNELLLIHADNLSSFDLTEFIKVHKNRPDNCELTMMIFETDIPETCGIVSLDENNVVQSFHEKVKNPPSNLANGAVYILSKKLVATICEMQETFIDFSLDVIPKYLNRICTYKNSVFHRDIGNMNSFNKAQSEFPYDINDFHYDMPKEILSRNKVSKDVMNLFS